ncbi:rab15 effector protein [Lepisosteus oculatus]|uniref:rab15 effector protein n=1 Tax=Lepisosteus oculatus TaxID=7918 RepID=UPI0003EA94CB|nr:PREDICTED: rab15 effector protein-like [Lepisosteus oculatus]
MGQTQATPEVKALMNEFITNEFKGIMKKTSQADFTQNFGESVKYASNRTKEYLLFQDPENTFRPSAATLNEVFLMTYINQSVYLQLTETFNCTTMTKEQEILLGADWVWALIDAPSKNPKVQIAVQVFHLSEEEGKPAKGDQVEMLTESMEIAKMESADKSKPEKMIEFCSSIGKDCYALFLFFGRQNDPGNIYGVLSNNFQAAFGKGAKIDQAFVENFFKGSKTFVTPAKMLQTIAQKEKKHDEPLTMVIKFT